MKTKAIILAAGRGNRLSAARKNIPKPLLPLSGKDGEDTFLDWHLQCLHRAGVSEIYLVGNTVTFNTNLNQMKNIHAVWILNPSEDLSVSGSAHSAWFAFNSPHQILDSKSRVILMDADIVYEPNLFMKLLSEESQESKILIHSHYERDSEEVLVFARNNMPKLLGKGLGTNLITKSMECLGEATGILLYEPGDHNLVKDISEWQMKYSTAKTNCEHEDLSQMLMNLQKMKAVTLENDSLFMEVDFPHEYEKLVNEIYPQLKRKNINH